MSIPLQVFTKDPDATLTYSIDWSVGPNNGPGWLGADTLASAVWTAPTGMSKVSESNTTTVATVKVSGGTDGVDYLWLCRVTTAGGLTDDRTILIQVRHQ